MGFTQAVKCMFTIKYTNFKKSRGLFILIVMWGNLDVVSVCKILSPMEINLATIHSEHERPQKTAQIYLLLNSFFHHGSRERLAPLSQKVRAALSMHKRKLNHSEFSITDSPLMQRLSYFAFERYRNSSYRVKNRSQASLKIHNLKSKKWRWHNSDRNYGDKTHVLYTA